MSDIKFISGFTVVDQAGSLGATSKTWTFTDPLNGSARLQFGDITNLTGVITVSRDGGTTFVGVEAETSAGTGVAIGGTVTAVDYQSVAFNVTGATHVKFEASAGSGPIQLMVSDDDRFSLPNLLRRLLTGITAVFTGNVAHDAADSGNPVKVGTKSIASQSGLTLVVANDRSDAFSDLDGAVLTRTPCSLADIVSGNASNTDGTSTECIAAQSAGIRTYLTTIVLTNTSATAVYVEIKDGSTAMLTIPVPANTSGAVVSLPVPLRGTAATAWNFDPSAAATTVFCSMVGFKSKV